MQSCVCACVGVCAWVGVCVCVCGCVYVGVCVCVCVLGDISSCLLIIAVECAKYMLAGLIRAVESSPLQFLTLA